MFKINNKDIKTKSMTLFWCLYCKLWTYCTPFTSVSIFDIEQIDIFWSRSIDKYFGQKPQKFLLHPPPEFWNPYFFPVFFSFFFQKKFVIAINNVIIFIYVFIEYKVLGGRRWFFVKKLEKRELKIKHFWCRIG